MSSGRESRACKYKLISDIKEEQIKKDLCWPSNPKVKYLPGTVQKMHR